jgi:hemerythrin-like domain-containing protein
MLKFGCSLEAVTEAMRETTELVQCHYHQEDQFLTVLERHNPKLARKMTAQHEEALEMAARFEESLTDGHTRDALALARRFHATAQHNIIEEERDVFPVADRCFCEAEQEALLRQAV